MSEPRDSDDDRLERLQGTPLHPVGTVLRATYDADNHATLSAEVTALMINLSRVPYEPCAATLPEPPAQPATAPSLMTRVITLLGG